MGEHVGEHAKLSASGAKRWLSCPGSVRLESLFDETTSDYAEEGTKAHGLAEWTLRTYLGIKTEPQNLNDYTAEMRDYVERYTDYAIEIFTNLQLKYKDAIAFVEERVDFSKWVPSGFGTVDFGVIAGDTLHIIDLKYGKGVAVQAENNPQPRLYALGTITEYGWLYPIKTATTHIVQPRLNSISTETLNVKELETWGGSIKGVAKKAFAEKGEILPGAEQCRFCKARATCKARAGRMLESVNKIIRRKAHGNSKN